MKHSILVTALALTCLTSAYATTEQRLNKTFQVQPGGKLVVDVDFGSVQVQSHPRDEVSVEVYRKVSMRGKSAEESFLKDRPVEISYDDGVVTVRSKAKTKMRWSWGSSRTEGKYTVHVPAKYNAQIGTAGGSITVADVEGDVHARTSGGGMEFSELKGPLDGSTSGGSIRVRNCTGELKVNTSGGGIDVAGGVGSLNGSTSGGSVKVQGFGGNANLRTSGGGIDVENVTGAVDASTAGGSVKAVLPAAGKEPARLSTSGGGISVRVPSEAAFDLDAQTSAGSVESELPVTVTGKLERSRLKGPVNGGGKPLTLRTSAGSITVRKSS